MDNILQILSKACEEANKAAADAHAKWGDTGPIGTGYVVVPLKLRTLVKALESRTYGGGYKVTNGLWRGYNWTPRIEFRGQAADISFSAAYAAVKVLEDHGIDAYLRLLRLRGW